MKIDFDGLEDAIALAKQNGNGPSFRYFRGFGDYVMEIRSILVGNHEKDGSLQLIIETTVAEVLREEQQRTIRNDAGYEWMVVPSHRVGEELSIYFVEGRFPTKTSAALRGQLGIILQALAGSIGWDGDIADLARLAVGEKNKTGRSGGDYLRGARMVVKHGYQEQKWLTSTYVNRNGRSMPRTYQQFEALYGSMDERINAQPSLVERASGGEGPWADSED